MLTRGGTVTKGGYFDGEHIKIEEDIEARGGTETELLKDVERLTKMYTNKGHQIDFGFIDGTSSVKWEDDIYQCTKYTPSNTQSELDL